MKRLWGASVIVLALGSQSWAQTAVGVGTGIGVSKSTSKSDAVAVGGGVGNTGTSSPSASIVTGGGPLIQQNSTIPANQSVKTVPSVFAPGLAAAGLETCLGSVSVGASWLGTGLTGGGSIPDSGCAARLDARTLWSFGLKKAAVARLCLNADIYRSMPDVCGSYLPSPPPGYVTAPVAPVAYEQPYASGDIWLVDGKTGKDRLCKDYLASKQRCRVWDGEIVHRASAKKRIKSDVLPSTTAALTKEDTTK